MNIGLATDVGNAREINEDSVIAEAIPGMAALHGLAAVLLVADGMGGHQGGEVASGLAAASVRQAFLLPEGIRQAQEGRATSRALPASRALEVARQINRDVYAWGGQGTAHPGTTLTLCLCGPQQYAVVHVGDSRAYLLTRGGICQITEDDSWVGEAVRRGTMTLDEARESPLRNQLTKCIGIAPDVQPLLYEGAWQAGDTLLLCSDGLSEYVGEEELRDAFGSGADLQASCERLTALARERGGQDNISIVAACEGVPHTMTRKPPTWKGDAEYGNAEAAGSLPLSVKDPNRRLRPLLLGMIGAGFLVMGMAVGRMRHHAAPHAVLASPLPRRSGRALRGAQSLLPRSHERKNDGGFHYARHTDRELPRRGAAGRGRHGAGISGLAHGPAAFRSFESPAAAPGA